MVLSDSALTCHFCFRVREVLDVAKPAKVESKIKDAKDPRSLELEVRCPRTNVGIDILVRYIGANNRDVLGSIILEFKSLSGNQVETLHR